jgi:hypothetical protein
MAELGQYRVHRGSSAGRRGESDVIRELCTREDFAAAVRKGNAIVITDSAGPPRFHPSAQGCEHVTYDGFEQKVLVNKNKNGRYFAVGSRREAEERWPGLTTCFGWAR